MIDSHFLHPILVAGEWRPAQSTDSFHAQNPTTGERLSDGYPVSSWADLDSALTAAASAARALRQMAGEQLAQFLTRYAGRLEARGAELVEAAHQETGLPKSPRLKDVELPSTTTQLRQAASAVAEGAWTEPTIDSKTNIRSYHA